MNRVFCRPALLKTAILLAFPMVLPAQAGAPGASPTPDFVDADSSNTNVVAMHRSNTPGASPGGAAEQFLAAASN